MFPSMTTTQTETKLALPGAGLAAAELFVGRMIMTLNRTLGTRKSFERRFAKQRQAIARLITQCRDSDGALPVLIRRCPGMEDSSRNWSVWMTLDHLRIVNGEIAEVIAALSKGVVPGKVASTASVKPSPCVSSGVVRSYEDSCDNLLRTAAGIRDLRTSARYAHPWFGPLDASAWFSLAGGHMAIHRKQVECILRKIHAEIR